MKKEEIVQKALSQIKITDSHGELGEYISNAMYLYAKQQAVDFCTWFMQLSTDDLTYYIIEETSPSPVVQYRSRAEMYDLFIEQQNK